MTSSGHAAGSLSPNRSKLTVRICSHMMMDGSPRMLANSHTWNGCSFLGNWEATQATAERRPHVGRARGQLLRVSAERQAISGETPSPQYSIHPHEATTFILGRPCARHIRVEPG